MNYLRDLEMRGVKAAQRYKEEFKEDEWSFDLSSRCWTHKTGGGPAIFLERSEGPSKQLLLERLLM